MSPWRIVRHGRGQDSAQRSARRSRSATGRAPRTARRGRPTENRPSRAILVRYVPESRPPHPLIWVVRASGFFVGRGVELDVLGRAWKDASAGRRHGCSDTTARWLGSSLSSFTLPGAPAEQVGDPDTERHLLFGAVVELVTGVSMIRPVLLASGHDRRVGHARSPSSLQRTRHNAHRRSQSRARNANGARLPVPGWHCFAPSAHRTTPYSAPIPPDTERVLDTSPDVQSSPRLLSRCQPS
jgi:hypothetical protein